MKLVIVESYNKIKSIKKFLGNDYDVIASGGHIRELKSNGYGYNKETLMPIWEVYHKNNEKKNVDKTISELKKAANEAEVIYLATDPDREGEAISWHIYDILDKKNQKKCERITFNEITKKAILNAIDHPREIDMNLVYSQWTRRILDRMVGFGLSSLVKSKLHAISAGRVQSVALLFIVERYLDILNFKPQNWWTIQTFLKPNKTNEQDIEIFLREVSFECDVFGPKSLSEFKFAKEEDATKCLLSLSDKYKVYQIDEPTVSKAKQLVPFQTDTLLSSAYSKLNWSTSKTQSIAQELYNGIEINGEISSLISYPRTDTNRLNDDFIKATREYINETYGNEYVAVEVKDANTGPLVQGAHEGIRPIDIKITPKSLEGKINAKNANDILKLYTLIWTQTVAAFMNVPLFNEHVVRFVNNNNKFYTSYKHLKFNGYYALPHFEKKNIDSNVDLSYLKVGDELQPSKKPVIQKHETQPSPLYNEGSLVKELKKSGVGRPSTYSTMVNIVKARGYVLPKKELTPTPIGIDVIAKLREDFHDFISKEFTAQMEVQLDEIAEGKENWNQWLQGFRVKFDSALDYAKKTMEKVPNKPVGRNCPLCNRELIYQRNYRNHSEFIACSGYKEGCRYTESLVEKKPVIELDELCPECSHKLVQRYNKKGDSFIGCTNFPKCRYVRSLNKRQPKKENDSDLDQNQNNLNNPNIN